MLNPDVPDPRVAPRFVGMDPDANIPWNDSMADDRRRAIAALLARGVRRLLERRQADSPDVSPPSADAFSRACLVPERERACLSLGRDVRGHEEKPNG